MSSYYALSGLVADLDSFTRGDAPRVARRLPLAFIFHAFGAVHSELRLLKVVAVKRDLSTPDDGLEAIEFLLVEVEVGEVAVLGVVTVPREG